MQALTDHRVHGAANFSISQLGLGLTFKLGIGQLDAYHSCQTLTDIFTRQVGLVFFDVPLFTGEIVDHPRQGSTKPGHVGAAFLGVDTVGEGINNL